MNACSSLSRGVTFAAAMVPMPLTPMVSAPKSLIGALLHESELARAGGWNPAPPAP